MTIGIMGAMNEEVQFLVDNLTRRQDKILGQRIFHSGNLWGRPVTLVISRMGKVAAATTATTLIHYFGVAEILFTGVAGAVTSELKQGDIVIGRQLFQHDLDARPFFDRHEIPLLGTTALTACPQRSTRLRLAAEQFFSTKGFAQISANAKTIGLNLETPKIIEADIASGDQFFADHAAVNELRQRLPSVQCVEMEGAAVAQVCHEHAIPFSILRTISDSGDAQAALDFATFIKHVASAYAHGIVHQLLAAKSSNS